MWRNTILRSEEGWFYAVFFFLFFFVWGLQNGVNKSKGRPGSSSSWSWEPREEEELEELLAAAYQPYVGQNLLHCRSRGCKAMSLCPLSLLSLMPFHEKNARLFVEQKRDIFCTSHPCMHSSHKWFYYRIWIPLQKSNLWSPYLRNSECCVCFFRIFWHALLWFNNNFIVKGCVMLIGNCYIVNGKCT